MPEIKVRDTENLEAALRRFKKVVEKAGTLTELRSRECYEKPTTERKRMKAAGVKRCQKKTRSQMLPRRGR